MDSYTSSVIVDAYSSELRAHGSEENAAKTDSPIRPGHFSEILADIADAGLKAPQQALRECCYRLLQAGLPEQALAVFELLVQQYTGLPPYSDLMAYVLSRNPELAPEVRFLLVMLLSRS